MVKFVVTTERRYWWTVKVRVPNADERRANQFEEFSFKVQFEDIGTEEADQILSEVNALPVEQRVTRQHDLLLRVVTNWDQDIVDEEGNAIPFDTPKLRALLDDGRFATGLWRAWGDSQRDEGGRRKN
ncbi:hypothetical protein [Devosia sediminis]|uniref:Uncharacterized protein n=1 Tax=Devosia sediminis TaxID=2798801 RepID=A0A934IW59_9HYPH|nr:hypothetical protein [Devosia sediminis]MBJ3783417.1 hypothetical protein [Devosia sediminis]